MWKFDYWKKKLKKNCLVSKTRKLPSKQLIATKWMLWKWLNNHNNKNLLVSKVSDTYGKMVKFCCCNIDTISLQFSKVLFEFGRRIRWYPGSKRRSFVRFAGHVIVVSQILRKSPKQVQEKLASSLSFNAPTHTSTNQYYCSYETNLEHDYINNTINFKSLHLHLLI